ncbi:MAG: hypothetical protein WCB53_01095 [Terriglobales bacterium]
MASTPTTLPQSPGLMQDLLHLVSQPLTTLHCALELSLTQDESERGTEEVALALEQTERVIEAVRLMRVYLESEEGCFVAAPFPLGLAVENVLEQISVPAEARGLSLFAFGTSTVAIPVRSAWLQRALFYLIGSLMENCPPRDALAILLEDGASHSVVSGHILPIDSTVESPASWAPRRTPEMEVLRQVKIEIARRVLSSSGASLEFSREGKAGFMIRIPRSRLQTEEVSA